MPVTVAPRRHGRPALVEGERPELLSVRLPQALHAAACRVALREGESVSSVVRRALARWLYDESRAPFRS